MWVGIAILAAVCVVVLWGIIRIIAGFRALRRSERAFLEDMRPAGVDGKADDTNNSG